MKKVLLITTICSILLTGCTKPAPAPVQSEQYITQGRYYTDSHIITNDGNCWDYSTDIISDRTVQDNMPVFVAFDDNGTPDNIYDDVILGCVYDINTAIYDELEDKLSESFELERDGNNIRIITD